MALDAPPSGGAAPSRSGDAAEGRGRDGDDPGSDARGREGGRRSGGLGGEERRPRGRLEAVAVPVALGVIAFALRLATAASGPTDWDSAQYAAAVGRYDVTHGRPQPPGYWLYAFGGRLVHDLSGLGVVHSLVLVAALASAVATALTALAGRDLGGRWVGLAAGLVMVTCPFVWFSGSVVATYSFDALACALLVDLAWRASPGSWHGVGAAFAFALLAGFRQSVVESFLLLALVPVVASTRHWRRLLATVVAAALGGALWFVPMAAAQPGGVSAWWRATRLETQGAAQSTSVLDHAAGAATNFGTFAAYTVLALGPLAVLALLAGGVLGVRRLAGRRASGRHTRRPPPRPWYQRRAVILAAAIVPPVALVTLVQFAKGGYLLAYLPAAVIALLLPLAAVVRRARSGTVGAWLAVVSLGVALVAALGAQRFLDGAGVLPASWTASPAATSGLWLRQPRYQAPYADTRAAIQQADRDDAALRRLRPLLRPARDVLVLDDVDGGADIYRNAGWALPAVRVSLVAPGQVLYNELGGTLYYPVGPPAARVAVAPSGTVLLVASPSLPGLGRLVAGGAARPVRTTPSVGAYRVWRVSPGSSLLGVPIVAEAGPRPLGGGIT